MKFSELDYQLLEKPENIDLVYELVMGKIKDYAKEPPNSKTNPDCLVVLGCSPIPVKSRVIKTVELYKKGYGKYIILTGGKGWHKISQTCEGSQRMVDALKETVHPRLLGNGSVAEKKALKLKESELMKKILFTLGEVPPLDVFEESSSNNTPENAKFSEKLLEDLEKRGRVDNIQRVMLITSCFHCRRAMLTFRKSFPKGVEVLVCPGTWDLAQNGLKLTKEDLLSNPYYQKQIYRELSQIITYTRKGDLDDSFDIEEFVGKNMASTIEALHHRHRKTLETTDGIDKS